MTEEEFDHDEFAQDVNSLLKENKSVLRDFHNYAGDTYTVQTETHENITNGDVIYIDVNYDEDISGESLILTIKFNINSSEFESDEYTVNDYDLFEVYTALDELYEDFLIQLYEKHKDLLPKFSAHDLDFLIGKYPEDQLLKSLKTGSKYKLFDSFISEIYTSEKHNMLESVNSMLNDKFLKDLNNYEEDHYSVYNEEIFEINGDNIYIDIIMSDEEEYSTEIYFDVNSEFEPIKDKISSSPTYIANTLNRMIEERLIQHYKNNKNVVQRYGKDAINMLAREFPEDPLLKSLKTGNKYKLFDAFIHTEWDDNDGGNEMSDVTQLVSDEISKYLDKDIIGYFGSTGGHQYTIEDDFLSKFGPVDDTIYVMLEESGNQVTVTFDCNNSDVTKRTEILVDNDVKSIAKVINELMIERIIKLYNSNNELAKHLPKIVLKKMLEKNPDNTYLKSLYAGSKYKLFGENKENIDYIIPTLPYYNENIKAIEKSDIDDDDPIMKGLIDYFNNILDKIFEECKVESSDEYELLINIKEDIVLIKIQARSTVNSSSDIPERIIKLREIATGLERFLEVLKKYSYLKPTIKTGRRPGASYINFESKLSDLMKIKEVENLINSYKGGSKYKLFMSRDEKV